MTMEYIPRGDLQKHLDEHPDRPLPEVEVREISKQILEGLSFMHENGFVHRELKPAVIVPNSTM